MSIIAECLLERSDLIWTKSWDRYIPFFFLKKWIEYLYLGLLVHYTILYIPRWNFMSFISSVLEFLCLAKLQAAFIVLSIKSSVITINSCINYIKIILLNLSYTHYYRVKQTSIYIRKLPSATNFIETCYIETYR